MSDELTPLSEREMEIVQLLATGITNQQIAQELVISVNTVKVHLRNIYAKLGVASRTEATMVAVRQGWVGVPRSIEEGKETTEDVSVVPPASALPEPDLNAPVSLAKRLAFVVAVLVALALVFVPLMRQGQANGSGTDPIGSVFPTVSLQQTGTRWRTRTQMPTPRNGLAVVAHKGLIYAIGGVSNDGVTGKVEIYDPQTDTWSVGRVKPTAVGFVSAVVVGEKIFVPGGVNAGQRLENVLEVYDPASDSWESSASMPVGLAAYGLAAFHDQLYLFGGLVEDGYTDAVLRYDPQLDGWEALSSMDKARGFLSAAALGDLIYVAGGATDVAEFKDCDAYDPLADAWTSQSSMDLRRGGLALVAAGERLYAIGGGMTDSGYLAFNEHFDSLFGTWTRFETPVTEQWRGVGAAYVKPYIYAIGGWHEGNLSVNEAYQAIFQVPIGP